MLEGIDGSGTTTQLSLVGKKLIQLGHSVQTSCEPTQGPVGALIRQVLSGKARLGQNALAHLFAADREEHVNGSGGIRECLAKGMIALSDRYLFSSLAYQTISEDPALPFSINAPFPLPEALFFLDIDPDISLDRIRGRGELEVFENRPFQMEVARRYRCVLGLFGETGTKIYSIDARMEPEAIANEIIDKLIPLLG